MYVSFQSLLKEEEINTESVLQTHSVTNITSIQSGRSSLAKHGGAYFSAVNGSIKDPIAAPGPYENQEC